MTDLFDFAARLEERQRDYPNTPGFKVSGTSRDAADANEPRAETLRQRVLRELQQGKTLTADEIAAALNESILSVRPRVTELRRMGEIAPTGERRANASGQTAMVWRRAMEMENQQ